MADGIYVALSGAIAQATNLDTTATNLANAETDGYQRVRPIFREALARAGTGEPAMHYASLASTALDTTAGALRQTGRPLDFALPPGTYLAVSTARGERYTRACSLSVGAAGALVTSHGDAVLADNGDPIKVTGDPSAVRLDESGQLWMGDTAGPRLKVVTFAQPSALAHEDGPVLAAQAAAGQPVASRGPLTLEHLEGSNSSAVGAMTDLVTASRQFDAFQRVIDAFRDADRNVVTTVPGTT